MHIFLFRRYTNNLNSVFLSCFVCLFILFFYYFIYLFFCHFILFICFLFLFSVLHAVSIFACQIMRNGMPT